MLEIVSDSAETTIVSAASLNVAQIQQEWTVLATLGTLVVTIMVCMLIGHHFDVKSHVNVTNVNVSVGSWVKNEKRTSKAKKRFNSLIGQQAGEELAILEESLPRVLDNRTLGEKLSTEVKQHHRWLGVIFNYSETFPRSLRVLSLATNIIVMLFVQSVTYNLTNPDDGSCRCYHTESTCTKPTSSFGTGERKCSWMASTGVDGSCSFVEPTNSFSVVLFVAIFSAIVSAPIAIAQNILIQRYLAAPISHGSTNEAQRVVKSIFKEAKVIDDEAHRNYDKLTQELKAYRQSLTTQQLHEFDRKIVVVSLLFFF
jgi:hypothetical protein